MGVAGTSVGRSGTRERMSIAQLGGDAAGGGAAGGGRGPRGPSRRALNGVDLSGHLRLTTTESHDFRRVPCTRFGLPRRRTSPTLLTEAAASGSRRREGMCPALALRPDRHDVAGHRRRRVEERGAMWLPSSRCLTLQPPDARPSLHPHASAWLRRKTPPHSSASKRRFSKPSPRRYAASTLSPNVCASAISATSCGKLVCSAARRNVLRSHVPSVRRAHAPKRHEE